MKIFKYPLQDWKEEHCYIEASADSEILHFALQNGTPTLWLSVDLDRPMIEYTFTLVGTGFDVPPDSKYIGTIFTESFVWHLFQEWLVSV